MSSTVTTYGWEVHYQGGSSDKFYRILLLQTADDRWTALANYGGRDKHGQFKAYNYNSFDRALAAARDKTNEKHSKGYKETRALTTFTVPTDVAFGVVDGEYVRAAPARRLVEEFIKQSYIAGTDHGKEASA